MASYHGSKQPRRVLVSPLRADTTNKHRSRSDGLVFHHVRYLVLDGGDVALVPPVDGAWGFQEVGLHEQGSPEFPLGLQLVAIHDLPELLMSLWEDKSILMVFTSLPGQTEPPPIWTI